MSEAMSMEHLEDILRRLQNIADHAIHIPGERPFVMSLDDGIAIHEAIELLEAKSTQWIPVSERMPDEEGEYTVCFDDGYITTVSYGMVIDRMDWELWADSGEPVAWMPLPEPYTKE